MYCSVVQHFFPKNKNIFSTKVVFWPIFAEISTNLLFWGHQNSQNFSHLRSNFGRIPIKNTPFFPRGLMNPFDSQKFFGVLPALFGTSACISDKVLKKHQKYTVQSLCNFASFASPPKRGGRCFRLCRLNYIILYYII